MGLDPFSPIAPARVGVLVLPIGRIRANAFTSYVRRLQVIQSVRLGDVTVDERPGRGLFSPLAFPDGRIYLDVSTSAFPIGHSDLSPFELFRTQMIVVGIADADEYSDEGDAQASGDNIGREQLRDRLSMAMQEAKEDFPGVLLAQLVVISADSAVKPSWLPPAAILADKHRPTGSTPMTILCDVAGQFLGELAGYAEEVKSWVMVATPASLRSEVERFDAEKPDFTPRLSGQSYGSPREGSPDPQAPAKLPRPTSKDSSSSAFSAGNGSRPASPAVQSDSHSVNSFDGAVETPTTVGGLWRSRPKQAPSRNDTPGKSMFPPASSLDRNKSVGKARVGVTLATLYLMAGRWPDAWREFNEHVGKFKANNDYVWLSSCLERMVICMILLGSEGFNFHIPSICMSAVDKQGSTLFAEVAKDGPTTIGAKDLVASNATLRKLGHSLGDICTSIMAYYDRARTYFGEALPQIILSEMLLRLTRLQSFVSTTLKVTLYDHAFSAGRLDALRLVPTVEIPYDLSRLAISDFLFRAYPSTLADIPSSARAMILAGIATCLATLKMQRRRAMVTRDLVTLLIPGLQQARRAGAAELGIFPSNVASYASAMLATSPADKSSTSIHDMLSSLADVYAIRQSHENRAEDARDDERPKLNELYEKMINVTVEAATSLAELDAMGSANLKIDILRESIDFCESLGDFNGMALNICLLLRIAGPSAPVNPAITTQHVSLAKDEQVRLLDLLKTSVSSAVAVDGYAKELQYWDQFLVRNVQLTAEETHGRLVPRSDQPPPTAAKQGPFLHDAFAKKVDKKQEHIVIAGEAFPVGIILQNPYEFELEIEAISLITEGGSISIEQSAAVLGPSRLQEVVCFATIPTPSIIKIVGCEIKLPYCRKQFFPIYNNEWRAAYYIKVKEASKEVPRTLSLDSAPQAGDVRLPATSEVSLKAISAQPRLAIEHVSLRDHSLTIAEGETKSFTVTLKNTSSISIEYINASFEDSLSERVRNAVSSKEMSREALHDVEADFDEHPIFAWTRIDDEGSQSIHPDQTVRFRLDVCGRTGLNEVRIVVDYANVDGAAENVGRFFMRRLSIPFFVTVNPSLQVHHFDAVSHGIGSLSRADVSRPGDDEQSAGTIDRAMITLDLRNVWNSPLLVTALVEPSTSSDALTTDGPSAGVSQQIWPGQVCRFSMPLERLWVQNPFAPVPQSSSHARRQFVISSDYISPQQERSTRELFRYREELLKRVSVRWKDEHGDGHGFVNLRSLRINHRQLEALRMHDISVTVRTPSTQKNSSCLEVKTGQFSSITMVIQNRSTTAVTAILRMQPLLANQPFHDDQNMIGRRFIWSGLLQRPLKKLEPGQASEESLDFCLLTAGLYEVGILVEEVVRDVGQSMEETSGHDATADHDDFGAAKLMEGLERRAWRLQTPCLIRATD